MTSDKLLLASLAALAFLPLVAAAGLLFACLCVAVLWMSGVHRWLTRGDRDGSRELVPLRVVARTERTRRR